VAAGLLLRRRSRGETRRCSTHGQGTIRVCGR
jgi:hypothetical protein